MKFTSQRSPVTYAQVPPLGTPSLSVDGNIALGATNNLFKGGKAFMWDDTVGNFALGRSALASVRGYASENTAVGTGALEKDYGHTGVDIPYTGPPDLYLDSSYNSAFGYEALQNNKFGHDNSAFGAEALLNNDYGIRNTGIGAAALRANSEGEDNTAVGAYALIDNDGGANTAVGTYALQRNSYASGNTAVGWAALRNNTVDNGGYVGGRYAGDFNTALGSKALIQNGSGAYNTAVGRNALSNVTTGSNNIALGAFAGSALTGGDHDDIMIGHPGYAGDSGVIAIGKTGKQSKIYVAAIDGVTTDENNAVSVVVAGNNQLGTVSSSRRFKQDIESMGSATDKLYELRPVTFRYKKYVKQAIKDGKDPSKLPVEYGLIAEDVAKVYPGLVVYDKKGRPETIKYRFLAPMLLNEIQKEHREALRERSEVRAERKAIEREKTGLRIEKDEIAANRERSKDQESHLHEEVSELRREVKAEDASVMALEHDLERMRARLASVSTAAAAPNGVIRPGQPVDAAASKRKE
ncbi:MAG TPA: tail fiber domain-containing protein [Thermoanaerobaculia bacterium]|nr:tail fiber domain-containing protein [Thermoanaerobaculia bacterium]